MTESGSHPTPPAPPEWRPALTPPPPARLPRRQQPRQRPWRVLVSRHAPLDWHRIASGSERYAPWGQRSTACAGARPTCQPRAPRRLPPPRRRHIAAGVAKNRPDGPLGDIPPKSTPATARGQQAMLLSLPRAAGTGSVWAGPRLSQGWTLGKCSCVAEFSWLAPVRGRPDDTGRPQLQAGGQVRGTPSRLLVQLFPQDRGESCDRHRTRRPAGDNDDQQRSDSEESGRGGGPATCHLRALIVAPTPLRRTTGP